MSHFKLKHKMLLLTITPLVIAVIVVMLIVRMQLLQLGENEIKTTRASMMASKEETLRNYLDMAVSAVEPALAKASDPNDKNTQKEVADILRNLSYGENKDGYVFAYNFEGLGFANRPKPELEGKNLIGLKDKNGTQIIKELIDAAKNGGGFVTYIWLKPSKGVEVEKLSYAVALPKLNWMIGTGFYIDDIEDAVAAARERISEQITHTLLVISSIGGALLLIFVGIATFVANKVTQPLHETAEALLDISQGEGDLTRRLKVNGNDEVGLVAQGFNDFCDKTQHLIMDLKAGVSELSKSTDRMNNVVKRTHAEVQKQRHETAQTAAAVHEMAAAAQEVAGNAAGAASAAQEADDETVTGQRVVEETIKAIEELSNDINKASEVISQLDADADKIGTVVNVIKEIADQTNLLALNAAIEAARAGEYGRGFSVVADEVRTLANRTQQSTQEIQNMIERLLSGARQAVGVMETSRGQGLKTVDYAANASKSLHVITGSVSTITQMNTQIASAAEEQTAVAEEISQSVQQIADIAEHSAKNAEELSVTTEEMSALEQRLLKVVNQFKV